MRCVDVRTQAELDAALKDEGNCVHCVGGGCFVIGGSSTVEAWGSSRVVARESSSVEAWESSTVEAWGSSSVEAWGSSRVVARESSRVVATRNVAIHRESCACSLTGGTVIDVVAARSSVPGWIEHYGADADGESVVLFKALDAELRSERNMAYALGSTVEAPDWDPSPERECGGGLHFCAHPVMALDFFRAATRFVACRVALADIRCPRAEDQRPSKVRARKCVVLYEVGLDGKKLEARS